MLGGGGLPRGLGHNLLMQFSSLGSSKVEPPETDFSDTLTIQNDQVSYGKHVLAPHYVFFTLFGFWGGRGLPRGLGHNLLMQFSSLGSSRMVVPLPSSRCLAEGNRILAVAQGKPDIINLPLGDHGNLAQSAAESKACRVVSNPPLTAPRMNQLCIVFCMKL